MRPAPLLAGVVVLLGIALLASGGCSKGNVISSFVPNERPTLVVTQAPVQGAVASGYAYLFEWAGNDLDGSIDHFLYTVDPPTRAGGDTSWVVTKENRHSFAFTADSVAGPTRSERYHVVVVVAVDDRGARSLPVVVAFTASTLAPTVQILQPVPSHLLLSHVASSVHITWSGHDADGPTGQPVRYKYIMLNGNSPFSIETALVDPDSLRRYYAPAFAGWDSVPGSVTSVDYRGLTIGQDFLFAIVAFDTAGAYSAVFTADQNMLQLETDPALTVAPTLTLYNESFSYSFTTGGFYSDPAQYIHEEFAADVATNMHWTAKAVPGSFVQGSRWAVDINQLDDEAPRTDESRDLAHWSQWTTATNIVLPPYHPAPGHGSDTHFFYLEVEDNNLELSLAVIQFTVVSPTFEHPLLIVDDTWVTPDTKLLGGCIGQPHLAWPTASELDSFLVAVGGKPIKCYPGGSTSTPGIFAGYAVDTVRTHSLSTGTISLTRLDHYRNIIWMIDGPSVFSGYTSSGAPAPFPQLRTFAGPGSNDPLATWLLQGGRLWLLGGGAASATQLDYVKPHSVVGLFPSADSELVAGRFMFDLTHWRSEITVQRTIHMLRSDRAVGGWPGAPDYSLLPPEIDEKSPDTDPMPPWRTSQGDFYQGICYAEYLSKPNAILEGDDVPQSVLDTLYTTDGAAAGGGRPVMTYYHGGENGPVLFMGTPLWYFRRDHEIQLVDFVLQRVWGMTRSPVAR